MRYKILKNIFSFTGIYSFLSVAILNYLHDRNIEHSLSLIALIVVLGLILSYLLLRFFFFIGTYLIINFKDFFYEKAYQLFLPVHLFLLYPLHISFFEREINTYIYIAVLIISAGIIGTLIRYCTNNCIIKDFFICRLDTLIKNNNFIFKTRFKIITFISFILFSFFIYYSFSAAEKMNPQMGIADQDAYVYYTIDVKKGHFFERSRMPLYPFIQSLFISKHDSPEFIFYKGKRINIIISVLLILFLSIFLTNKIGILPAFIITAIYSFKVIIFKSFYFQAEVLFYFMLFFAIYYLSILFSCKNPSIKSLFLSGIFSTLAYLSKGAILPILILFFITIVLYIIKELIDYHKLIIFHRALRLIMPLFIFFILVSPYIIKNKIHFGSFFYNVNSTFYMWYDTWDEAKKGTIAHNDKYEYPNMPAELIPSPVKYFKTHSLCDIIKRLITGIDTFNKELIDSEIGIFKYLLIIAFFTFLLVFLELDKSLYFFKKNFFSFFFIGSFFLIFILLYGWYVPIASGNRYVFSLILPFLFFTFLLIVKLKIESTISEKLYYFLLFILLVFFIRDLTNIPFILFQYFGAY